MDEPIQEEFVSTPQVGDALRRWAETKAEAERAAREAFEKPTRDPAFFDRFKRPVAEEEDRA